MPCFKSKGWYKDKLVRAIMTASTLCAMAAFGLSAGPVQAASMVGSNCQDVRLPVALQDGLPTNQTVVGTLCTPGSWAPGAHELDVLVHGGTYNRSYWDWTQNPPLYSYVDKTLAAGRAVFYYDRIGNGQSSHPLSTEINVVSNASVLHQIVQWTRHSLGYSQVNLVAHSMGSLATIQEAGTYNDADRVVITGILHDLADNPIVPAAFLDVYPANQDPEFAGQNLDSGYITTKPGTRASLFYYTPGASPSVIAYDELTKDIMSTTEVLSDIAQDDTPAGSNVSYHIAAPVLLVVGQEDPLFCGNQPITPDCTSDTAVRDWEAPYFTSAANFTVKTVPNTGHNLALHSSADQSFDMINDWLKSH